ncbi:MAG: hypothetical protein ACREXO_22130 [Advenella sp.]
MTIASRFGIIPAIFFWTVNGKTRSDGQFINQRSQQKTNQVPVRQRVFVINPLTDD